MWPEGMIRKDAKIGIQEYARLPVSNWSCRGLYFPLSAIVLFCRGCLCLEQTIEPPTVISAATVSSFKKRLKTHLFHYTFTSSFIVTTSWNTGLALLPYPCSHPRRRRSASFLCLLVCLSVCLLFHTISQKSMQLWSQNFTEIKSTTSRGNPFILGVNVYGHEAQNTPGVGFCTFVGASFF